MAARKTAKRRPTKKKTSKRAPKKASPKRRIVSLRGLAKEIGSPNSVVEAAIKSGRLDGTWTRKGKGPYQFDLEAALEAWVRNATQPTKLGDPEDLKERLDLDAEIPDRRESQRRLDHWRAQNEKLKFLEAAGELVAAKSVERDAAAAYSSLREALLAVAGRVRDDLADEDDPAVCEHLVLTAIEDALRSFASEPLTQNGTRRRA